MNDSTKHSDNEREGVKKLLHDLSKAHATDDFEIRLQRKIAQGTPKKRFIEYILSHPIPSFAYSLLIVIVTGVVWYYSYVKYVRVDIPVITEPTETKGQLEQNMSSPYQDQHQEKSLKDVQEEVSVRSSDREQRRRDVPSNQGSSGAGVSSDLKVEESSVDESKVEIETQVNAVETEKKLMKQQESAEFMGVPSTMQEAAPKAVSSFKMNEAAIRKDSSALQDSLKADSLRQAKQLKEKVQRQKAKNLKKN